MHRLRMTNICILFARKDRDTIVSLVQGRKYRLWILTSELCRLIVYITSSILVSLERGHVRQQRDRKSIGQRYVGQKVHTLHKILKYRSEGLLQTLVNSEMIVIMLAQRGE